jgi:hypothetical protein
MHLFGRADVVPEFDESTEERKAETTARRRAEGGRAESIKIQA